MKSDKKKVLGIDIGGTNMRLGLVDEQGGLEKFEMIKTSEVFGENPALALANEIKRYLSDSGEKVEAIVIGFPSTIDRNRQVVLSTPNIKGLNNFPVVEGLKKFISVPVFIEKDVNLIFEYDMFKKKIDKDKIALGFYIGTGFGNAIQVGGELLVGKNGVAGELGHAVVLNDDKPCPCGNFGCIEGYASGKYLEELHQKYFSSKPLEEIFVHFADNIDILRFVDNLSAPIASEINIFDPDFIVIGGGVLLMKDFPKKTLEEFVLKHTRKPFPHDTLKFSYSDADQKSGVIGAGIHGFRKLKKV